MPHPIRHLLRPGLVALAALACAVPALAQDFPAKAIRMIVPVPAGGGVDLLARTIGQKMSANLGVPVVVENKPGAGGMIGADLVAKAAPDGYTLLVGNVATLAMNVGIYRRMTYDPVKDFAPILQTVRVNYVVVVHPDVPVKSVAELVAYAKANPGKLSYGSSGSGSAQHMAAELFKAQTGANLTHVPYKGTGALVGDLVAGHVSLAFADEAQARAVEPWASSVARRLERQRRRLQRLLSDRHRGHERHRGRQRREPSEATPNVSRVALETEVHRVLDAEARIEAHATRHRQDGGAADGGRPVLYHLSPAGWLHGVRL